MIMSLGGNLALPPKDNRGWLFYSVVPSNEELSIKKQKGVCNLRIMEEEIEDPLHPPSPKLKASAKKRVFYPF